MERVSPHHLEIIPLGPDLDLCPVQPDHAAELYALVEQNRTRLREWLPWIGPDYSLSDAARFAALSESDNQRRVSLTSVIRVHGHLAGAIGLHRINYAHRSTSIGYWLAASHNGRGIMTAACRAMVTHGFIAYGLHRIEIRCATGNVRSAAIPQRLGFHEEGVMQEAEWLYDHWVDLRVFSMLEQNWTAR